MTDSKLNYKLQSKLEEIAGILCKSQDKFDNPGVLSGVSGLALFMFYWSRFTGDSKYADIGGDALAKAVEMINNGYSLHTYCSGISGLAWTCEHLVRHRFIDGEDISFLNDLEPYLLSCMERDFDSKNYDFLHGGLGVGYYFITAQKTNPKAITALLDSLERTAEKTSDGSCKWKSVLNSETQQEGYNISLSHGMSSIVACLVKLITDRPVFTSKVTPLLSGTVNYIFQQKSATPILSYFPNYSMESCPQSHYSRLGWCYGDLGISQAILSASGVMENKDWKDTAIKIFIHSGHRKDVRRNSVHDAGLCHGSIGVAHIFCRLYRKTGMEVFNEAAKYWYRKTLEYSIFGDTCAGYKHLIFPDKKRVWVNNFGLLAGITGIGLGIMSYLDHELTSWDECLLLS